LSPFIASVVEAVKSYKLVCLGCVEGVVLARTKVQKYWAAKFKKIGTNG
jgi:hypothetical protein